MPGGKKVLLRDPEARRTRERKKETASLSLLRNTHQEYQCVNTHPLCKKQHNNKKKNNIIEATTNTKNNIDFTETFSCSRLLYCIFKWFVSSINLIFFFS